MVLKKEVLGTLTELDGQEMTFRGKIILVKYPSIVNMGKESNPSEREWKQIYDAYWKDSNNEGYWLVKDLGIKWR